jgi:hypothetical protein
VAKRTRPRKHFKCSCKTGKPELKAFSPFNRGNRATNKFHKKGGLRPELFAYLNPIKGGREAAEEAEEELALSLRADGHAVHFN